MVRCIHVSLVLAVTAGLLSAAAVITLIVLWSIVLSPFADYAVVIDAGSTHSKIFLYTWPADKSDGLGTTSKITQVKACDVPGDAISSVSNPTSDNVKQYFDSAMTNCTSDIPLTRKSRTLIFLGATAGLRLVNIKDPAYIVRLLNATRAYFSTLGLLFRDPINQVRIIDGSEEGLSGWITVNILMRQLFDNNRPDETYGVIDMGGASTQISFIAPNALQERYDMNLFNTYYSVYSHSYLCYGQEQMRLVFLGRLIQNANGNTRISDPCLQSGYIQNMTYEAIGNTACAVNRYTAPSNIISSTNITIYGTGNFTECQRIMRSNVNKSACSGTLNCSFDNVYQPVPISSSIRFIAMSAVYSTFNTLAPTVPIVSDSSQNYNIASTNITQIYQAIEKVCNQPWSNVSTTDFRYRPFLCFYSMYHWTLFQYGYSMNGTNFKNFQIVKAIDSAEIGWTLGYMINQTNYIDAEFRPARLLTRAEFIGILVCFLVIFVISTVVVIVTTIFLLRNR